MEEVVGERGGGGVDHAEVLVETVPKGTPGVKLTFQALHIHQEAAQPRPHRSRACGLMAAGRLMAHARM